MASDIEFEVIPEKVYGVFKADGVIVSSGQSIGQAIASAYPNVISKTPPPGKKFILTVGIRGFMEDAP